MDVQSIDTKLLSEKANCDIGVNLGLTMKGLDNSAVVTINLLA
jgi:hypothetical protein